jgi:bacterioferritin-associated ferredoxin
MIGALGEVKLSSGCGGRKLANSVVKLAVLPPAEKRQLGAFTPVFADCGRCQCCVRRSGDQALTL